MAQTFDNATGHPGSTKAGSTTVSAPALQAYQILRFAFTVAPIVAGLDKFFQLLVNWDQYLPSFVNKLVGGHGHELMLSPA